MYSTVKLIHICSAALTISGFTLRGIWMLTGSDWLQRRWVRVVPHAVDTIFLLSGIGLIWILRLPVLDQPWLLAKLAAVVVYILLGMLALGRGRTMRTRTVAFILALAIFAYITGVALSKSTLSWLG